MRNLSKFVPGTTLKLFFLAPDAFSIFIVGKQAREDTHVLFTFFFSLHNGVFSHDV